MERLCHGRTWFYGVGTGISVGVVTGVGWDVGSGDPFNMAVRACTAASNCGSRLALRSSMLRWTYTSGVRPLPLMMRLSATLTRR